MPDLVIPALVAFAGPAVALGVIAIGHLTAPSLPTTSARQRARTESTHG